MGVFSFGIAITNIVHILILYLILSWKVENKRKYSTFKSATKYIFVILLLSTILALIQKKIYPSSQLFFLPESYEEDFEYYISLTILKEPIVVLLETLKSFFLTNFISPIPEYYESQKYNGLYLFTFWNSLNYTNVGIAGLVLLIPIFIMGFIRSFKSELGKINLNIAFLLCLIFEFVLRTIYGWEHNNRSEIFLYSPYFTFLTLIFASNAYKNSNMLFILIIIIVNLLMLVNNFTIILDMINQLS